MKKNKPVNILIVLATILSILVFLISSCAKMLIISTEQDGSPPKESGKTEPELREQKKLYEVLIKEAKAFSLKNHNKDALLVYNQAFAFAPDDEIPSVIEQIESVLIKTQPAVIEEFLENDKVQIPKPLLLYWLGLNYASDKVYQKAKTILIGFIEQYPHHEYQVDAKDLLTLIKKTLFKSDTIGCLLPLSGKYESFGQRALIGVQMAIDDLSNTHGKKFNVIIKDTQSDEKKAVECVRELNQKKVAAILGPLLTITKSGQEAEKLGIPMIALTQKNEFPLQGEFLFSNFITPEMQVQTLAAYTFVELGIKKVAILYPNERYGQRYMNLFWNMVDEFEGRVVGVEPYDGKNTDFTEPIKKLTGEFYPVPGFLQPKPVELDPDKIYADLFFTSDNHKEIEEFEKKEKRKKIDFDAIFIPDSPSKINLILPQLAFNDAKGIYLLGTNLWHHESLLTESKGYNKKAVITDGFFKESRNPVTFEFTRKFKKVFKKDPGFIEAISYDTAMILFTAAMDDQVDSRNSLKDALQGARVFEGVTGKTIFDNQGHANKELFLMTIKKGKFIEITR
jgi:branched-chain amino acid transport system substrate-binding protein